MKKIFVLYFSLITLILACSNEKTEALQVKQNTVFETILGYNLDSSEIKEVILLEKSFILKYYPDPTPSIAGKNGGGNFKVNFNGSIFCKSRFSKL